MKISIIKKDSIVTIDNITYNDLDLSLIDSDIKAIQFDTSTNKGHIEYNDDNIRNKQITSIENYQSIIDAHSLKKTKNEEEVIKKNQEIEDFKNSYIGKRQSEYPGLSEQLDYIYHNGIDKWKNDIILPIKNKYPKT